MSTTVILVLIGWCIALAIFFGFIVLLRYLEHREHMAMITRGMNPNQQRRSRGILRAGLITMMVGFSLTIGLYPIGFYLPTPFTTTPLHLGPWLLLGLIPLGVGFALTASYYLEQSTQSSSNEEEDKIISFKEHQNRESK